MGSTHTGPYGIEPDLVTRRRQRSHQEGLCTWLSEVWLLSPEVTTSKESSGEEILKSDWSLANLTAVSKWTEEAESVRQSHWQWAGTED